MSETHKNNELVENFKTNNLLPCAFEMPIYADLQWQWITDFQHFLAHRNVGYKIGGLPSATYIRLDEHERILKELLDGKL